MLFRNCSTMLRHSITFCT